MALKKAIGQTGSWFASVDGEQLPCVHKYWLTGLLYHDPDIRSDAGLGADKIAEYVNALTETKRAILTDDEPQAGAPGMPLGFKRKGYIAIYDLDDIEYSEADGLRFRLAKRVTDLK